MTVEWLRQCCVMLRETQIKISSALIFFSISHKGSLPTNCLCCWLVHHKSYVGYNCSALPLYCWGILCHGQHTVLKQFCRGTPCSFVLLWSYKIFQQYEIYVSHHVECLDLRLTLMTVGFSCQNHSSLKYQICCPVGAESVTCGQTDRWPSWSQ
jgi:hypothetical protein